jgi:putative transcriptional regulator
MASLAGSFLVARPVLRDPSFKQTVVLLLQHGDEGAFGLVVNRRAKVKGAPFPVFSGGPCPSQGFFMVHGHPDWAEPDTMPIAPGIYVGNEDVFQHIEDPSADAELRCRIFNGYAGWAAGQLEGELATGAWAVVPASGELLFDTPVEDLWVAVLPPAIPQPSAN